MKTTFIIASIVAPFITVAAANKPAVAKPVEKTLIEAKASGKMILIGNAAFGDRHVQGFLDRHFVVQHPGTQSETAYLLYDASGKLVHRVTGDTKYPYELAVKLNRGLDTKTQYYALLERFENGERSVELLENAIIGATDAQDHVQTSGLMDAYLAAVGEHPSEEQLAFIAKHTENTTEPGFGYLAAKEAHLDKLAEIIFEADFAPLAAAQQVDLAKHVAAVKSNHPVASLASRIDRMAIDLLDLRGDAEALRVEIPGFLAAHAGGLTDAQVAYYRGLAAE